MTDPPPAGFQATAPTHRKRIASPRLELVVEREAAKETRRVVTLDGERFHIGSNPKNHLVLDDPRVSRFHCTIERTESAWRVTDSGSLNGTYLGGIGMRDADLPESCTLVLGDSAVHVRAVAAATHVDLLDQASFGDLYGQSRVMQQLFAVLEKIANSDANVLIEGESGTGKELVAAELVRRGPRAAKPFVILDCSAISPNLIESELFGHARGAFTGADRERLGAFEAAHGGTVFLDEIGELPLDMQPKLLRALEAREVRRLGETTSRKVDVRVMAATNRHLEREVNRGTFREDLFYRLSVVTVRIPPLRDRIDDVELLVRAFLRDMGPGQRGVALFTHDVFDALRRHDWPGNVRELRNYVERCLVFDSAPPTGSQVSRDEVGPQPSPPACAIDRPFREGKERVIAEYERTYMAELIRWADGNLSRAARKAGMDRMNLYRVLQRHGLREQIANKE
jgi:DNA-binding NtrC family response regulator